VSKYKKLWQYVSSQDADKLTLSFGDIEKSGGLPIDHSFLTFKKELIPFGWHVGKISMKNETVTFEREK